MLNRTSPDRKSRRVTGILKALLTGPGLDQRAIHREVLVGKIRLGLLQHALEEFLRHLLVEQPIPEHRDCSARRSWCGCGTECKRCSRFSAVGGGAIAGQPGSAAIDMGPDTDQVYLILFGTGIRYRSSLSNVTVDISAALASVEDAEPATWVTGPVRTDPRSQRAPCRRQSLSFKTWWFWKGRGES